MSVVQNCKLFCVKANKEEIIFSPLEKKTSCLTNFPCAESQHNLHKGKPYQIS